jgi:CRP/FNR family transcriptional regulator, cyclic AMP receptor protein
MSNERKTLQYTLIWDRFSLRLRNELYAKAKYKNFDRDSYIYRRGDDGDFLVCVMSGRLRLSLILPEGKEILFSMVERGEMLGEVSVIDELPRATDLIADTDSNLMIIYRDDFIPLLLSCPEAMLVMMRTDYNWIRRYISTIELISMQNASLRVARYLLRLAGDYGDERDGNVYIKARLSQKDMARQISCSRESMNKQLSALTEKGFVSLIDDTIVINDVKSLMRLVLSEE